MIQNLTKYLIEIRKKKIFLGMTSDVRDEGMIIIH
jgi:hypothetical protein